MARYIDADKLIAEYDRVHIGAPGGARKLMVDAPIADVVPRSEVAMEIFEEIDKKVKASITVHLEEINKEYIKDTPLYDRHSGILFALQYMDDFIAELKKKYTNN